MTLICQATDCRHTLKLQEKSWFSLVYFKTRDEENTSALTDCLENLPLYDSTSAKPQDHAYVKDKGRPFDLRGVTPALKIKLTFKEASGLRD